MTIEEARQLIPPGWVECDRRDYNRNVTHWFMNDEMMDWVVFAIPAPKPVSRRMPCDEIMMVAFSADGAVTSRPSAADAIQSAFGGYDAVAKTRWRLDFDTREWVEVLE